MSFSIWVEKDMFDLMCIICWLVFGINIIVEFINGNVVLFGIVKSMVEV